MVTSGNNVHNKGQNLTASNDRRSAGAPRRSHTSTGRTGTSSNTTKDADNSCGSSGPSRTTYTRGGNTMQTIAALRSNGISHPSQQVTLTCYIPPYRVGAVIGRRGATILHIQREAAKQSRGHSSAVRVSVMGSHVTLDHSNNLHTNTNDTNTTSANTTNPQANANNEETASTDSVVDEWTPVVIRGDPCGAFAAAKLLVPLLSTGSTTGDDNNSDVMDDVVLDIPIHRSRHAAIIGRKGLTIATLSADHNVRIMVPHRVSMNEDTSNKQIHIVQLEGQLEQVIECCANMLSIVCSNSHNVYSSTQANTTVTQNGGNNNKAETTSSNEVNSNVSDINSSNSNPKPKKFIESSVNVPGNVILSLTRIKQIGKNTNTVIRRRKKAVSNDTSSETSSPQHIIELTITGRTECVTKATSQLERIIATSSSSAPSKSAENQSEDAQVVDISAVAEDSENKEPVEQLSVNERDESDKSTDKEDASFNNVKTVEAGNTVAPTGRKNPSSFNKRRNTRGGPGRGNFSYNNDSDNMNSKPKHNLNKRSFGPRNNKRGGRGSDLANSGRGETNGTKKSFDSLPAKPNGTATSS